jgi:DNA-binding protein H-NS
MTTMDLNLLSLSELKNLQKDVAKAIGSFDTRKKAEARAALDAHAKELGFALSDLLGTAPGKKTRKAPEAKYRHPENPDITWSGRGRKPHWFSAVIASGKPPESMAI